MTLLELLLDGSWEASVRAISASRDEMKDSGELWKEKDSNSPLKGIVGRCHKAVATGTWVETDRGGEKLIYHPSLGAYVRARPGDS